MSGFFEDDVEAAILDNIFGADAYGVTPPGTYYIALYEVMPDTDGSGGTEASYTDYARVAVTNDLTEFPAAAGSPPTKSNANDWDFGVAGSGPTDVVGFGFYDDPTSVLEANFWAAVTLTGAPVTINDGASVKFLAGDVDLSGC